MATPQPLCLRRFQERRLINKMKREPELKARVRDPEPNSVRAGDRHRFAEVWMVGRPLDIEEAPNLIDLALLLFGATLRLDRGVHQREWRRTTDVSLNLKVYRGRFSDGRLAPKRCQVLWLSPLSFAEDEKSAARSSGATRRRNGFGGGRRRAINEELARSSRAHNERAADLVRGPHQSDLGDRRAPDSTISGPCPRRSRPRPSVR